MTVLDSARVEAIEPVATPLASVTAAGCVIVLSLPVEASATVAPATGFPFASRAVTVIVLAAPPAVIVPGAEPTVDTCAETAPATKVTPAVCVIATPSAVAETTFAESSVLNPTLPAPCNSYFQTASAVVETLLTALAPFVPEKAIAWGGGTGAWIVGGRNRHTGQNYV